MDDLISRKAAIDAMRKLHAEDVEMYGVSIPECFDAESAIEALNALSTAQPDNDMIHLQKEQAYMQGWEEGREALRKEMWEDGRDRFD